MYEWENGSAKDSLDRYRRRVRGHPRKAFCMPLEGVGFALELLSDELSDPRNAEENPENLVYGVCCGLHYYKTVAEPGSLGALIFSSACDAADGFLEELRKEIGEC